MTERLVATTRRLETEVDLAAVAGDDGVLFERNGAGLAGSGVALTIATDGDLGVVAEALSAIERIDSVGLPGCGPVAFAAMPFDRDAQAQFIVPRIIVGRSEDGHQWETVIGTPSPADSAERPSRPTSYNVLATMPVDDWCGLVAGATDTIRAGEIEKVVLAREVVVRADAPIPRRRILDRLRRTFPGCYVTSVGPMVGASPELLVSRTGDEVRAHPMAGTAPRGGDPDTDAALATALFDSAKDRAEHQLTIDMVWESLLPFCSYVDSEPEPKVVGVANVQHLASMVEGRLSHPPASILELVAALHPTPAVAGWPVDDALRYLAANEGLDRARYAGPVGWVDASGNGTFAVGIRCAELDGNCARLFAGVGVVADSDPQLELAETEAKFQAVLSAIVRP